MAGVALNSLYSIKLLTLSEDISLGIETLGSSSFFTTGLNFIGSGGGALITSIFYSIASTDSTGATGLTDATGSTGSSIGNTIPVWFSVFSSLIS